MILVIANISLRPPQARRMDLPGAPQVHILATSREAPREKASGSQAGAVNFPPDHPGLTAAIALTFPAVELFLERAEASGILVSDLNDLDAAIVASIAEGSTVCHSRLSRQWHASRATACRKP